MPLSNKDFNRIQKLMETTVDDKVPKIVRDELKKEIGNLPTKDEFATQMSDLMGEVKAEREENKVIDKRSSNNRQRIDRIETRLNISTN